MRDVQILEQRLRDFAAAPDDGDVDWEDVLSRAGERSRPSNRRFSRRRVALVLAACVAVAALAGVFAGQIGNVLGVSGGARPGTTVSAPGGLTESSPDGSNPWGPNGREITLDQLRAGAPYVPLPNSDLANDGNVGTVWVWEHKSGGQVVGVAAAVYYPSSGIELMWTGTGLDYTGLTPSEQQTIDGVRALVLAGDPSTNPPQLSTLDLPVGPDHVVSLAGTVPEDELISVAKTLSPSPGGGSPGGSLPPTQLQPGPDLTFWDTPFTNGVVASSVDGAAGSLAFRPVAPSSLDTPSSILETDPASAPTSDRALSLRYDDSSLGRFWLLERPDLSTTTSLLREIASDCTRATGCKDVASMVDLGSDVSALSLEDPVAERVVWVQGGVYYEVVGPASTFTAAHALSVAKATATAAAG